jgi:thioredoxin 1
MSPTEPAATPGHATPTPAGPATSDVGTSVADIGDADFQVATTGRWTAVDLWAPWCGPCRRFMPTFEATAAQHVADGSPIAFARVNVDDNPITAGAMAVHSIPTVILFDPDGFEVARTHGVPGADDLDALLSHATNGTSTS